MLELLTPEDAAGWLAGQVRGQLQTDSRKIQAGDGFLAWPGAATDARAHVAGALQSGAVACLVEREGVETFALDDARVACYRGLKAASGRVAAAYYQHPTQQLDVLAVTGTNGKTSTVWWLAQALSNLKHQSPIPCGLIGTLGIGLPPAPGSDGSASGVVPTGLTTPDPVLLQHTFRELVRQGVMACAIEASSIGIEEHRLDGTRIRVAMLTNFTQDHLDYHGSMQAYGQAKARLFQWNGLQSAVINVDDEFGAALAAQLQGGALDVWTYSRAVASQSGSGSSARLTAQSIEYHAQGLSFVVVEHSGAQTEQHGVQTRVIGLYNVSNLLGVLAAMRAMGVALADAVASCADLISVPGRMECFGEPGQPLVAVDYAHTPDALVNALEALQSLAQQRGGQLWCVFGCGGDRDATKRPMMGAVAAKAAQRLVVTSDNPRSERPEAIMSQILLGITDHANVMVLADRAVAIGEAVLQAAPQDVILVAGKGHEDYQEIAGQRRPYSDLKQVRLALAARQASDIAKGSQP